MTADPHAVAQVLHRAADAYRTGAIRLGRDWFINEEDTCLRCVLGGITYVVDPDNIDDANPMFAGPVAKSAALTLADYVADNYGVRAVGDDGSFDPVETVGSWNDDYTTTVEEVIEVLDAAAARFDGAGGACVSGVYGIPHPGVCDCPLIDGEHREDECGQLLLDDAAEVETR